MKDGVRAHKGAKELVVYHWRFQAENLNALEARQITWFTKPGETHGPLGISLTVPL